MGTSGFNIFIGVNFHVDDFRHSSALADDNFSGDNYYGNNEDSARLTPLQVKELAENLTLQTFNGILPMSPS
ncbi:MAG: hypothetical protein R2827_15355 [Bdellovibrionales bacterium]